MATPFQGLLDPAEVTEILGLPAVLAAKEQLGAGNNSVSFTVSLPSATRTRLEETWGLPVTGDAVPMRWIRGDTRPHRDRGASAFERTHLAYLTDSPGVLRVGEEEYAIAAGAGYVFSEGVAHETAGTGTEPRLLLGPMSERGLAVGGATTISVDGELDTIYFKYISSGPSTGLFYRINEGGDNSVSVPITIANTNPSGGMLKVLFETDITVETAYTYFICGSSHIQFGSTSLNPDGTRPVITIDGVTDYPGLVRNGDAGSNGQTDIHIFNLKVDASGSTLVNSGGWVAQEYFGKAAANNYIVNCASTGDITDSAGGIVGAYAASLGGNLNINGCSSSGTIQQLGGGIVGKNAGENIGAVYCNQCWSTGVIQGFAGGIYGDYAGNTGGNAEATNSYSTGTVGNSAGGIFGRYAGDNGNALATGCYSRGNISTDAGGIFGIVAGSNGGYTTAINCYSSGAVTTSGTGIYGTGKVDGTATNCYIANGTWSTVAATAALTGTPSPVIGDTWVATTVNQPFELKLMGYQPYSLENITTNPSPSLIRTSVGTVAAGGTTDAAIVSGKSYTLLQTSGGGGTITIDSTTGAISTTTATPVGVYLIWIRNTGSYNITVYELTVTGGGGGVTAPDTSCCARPLHLTGVDYTTRAQVLAGTAMFSAGVRTPMSHADYLRIKKAKAFRF